MIIRRMRTLTPLWGITGLFCLLSTINCVHAQVTRRDCTSISAAFLNSSQTPACRCFTSGLRADSTGDSTWIGCTQKDLLDLHAALDSLANDTKVSKLWMWDCALPVLIPALFNKIRPVTLKIESSTTRKWMNGVFDQLADRLRHLELKQNHILELRSDSFAKLSLLERLDLSGNNVSKLNVDSLGHLPNLRQLYLQKNEISQIADNTFVGMSDLEHLNLAHNKLRVITRRTFAGLVNLETLTLSDNEIVSIEPGSFDHMQKLTSLNIGKNHLPSLELGSMASLQELLLYRNSFLALKDLKLTARLTALSSLSLERNNITEIRERDLDNMPQLNSLLLAFNKIESIHENAFHPVKNLRTLSLQDNRLRVIHDGLFLPVMLLENLLLSDNKLQAISERTFYGLRHLKVLVLTNNVISSFHRRALAGTFDLQRLYINHNQLSTLENGTFLYINDSVRSIDLSENPWNCNCSLLWLTGWLSDRRHLVIKLEASNCERTSVRITNPSHSGDALDGGNANVNLPTLSMADSVLRNTCSVADNNNDIDWSDESHNVWITVIAVVLAIVSLLILSAIAILYIQELKRGSGYMEFMAKSYNLHRAPSDMVNLITSGPMGHTNASMVGEQQQKLPGIIHNGSNTANTTTASAAVADQANVHEKKRVRFQGSEGVRPQATSGATIVTTTTTELPSATTKVDT